MRPEYLDPHLPDHSVAGDVLVREEPDDEEDEPDEDDDDSEEDDGDGENVGFSN